MRMPLFLIVSLLFLFNLNARRNSQLNNKVFWKEDFSDGILPKG